MCEKWKTFGDVTKVPIFLIVCMLPPNINIININQKLKCVPFNFKPSWFT
jgi:hypothetical protein